MPSITFATPGWLLLAPVLWIGTWWLARHSLAFGGRTRQATHLTLRCGLIALVCAALAEPHLRRRASDVAVIAVMDVSQSVPADQRGLVDQFLTSSLANKPAHDRFGLVTVARDAMAQSLPTTRTDRREYAFTGPQDASDVERGLHLASALMPGDAAGRLLLLSDGNETAGSLDRAASTLLAAKMPIDVAAIEYDRSAGVRIDEVIVPPWVRDGDTISARIVATAGKPATGLLTLLLNEEPVDLDPDSPGMSIRVELAARTQVLSQQLKLPPGPIHRVRAVFEPDDRTATIPDLLQAEGVTFTHDRGRVLVLAEDRDAVEPLVQSLSSENLRIDVRPAIGAPHELADWSAFDGVVLVDQPASNFTQLQQESIARAVHDGGIGMLVVGGPSSLGAGGWIGSPVADVLPVLLDPPAKKQIPMGALAIIIDCSGSMSSPVAGTGLTQQQIANEAAILGVRALSRLDQVTIIAFSGDSQVIVPLTTNDDPASIARRIRSIGMGGGTNLYPAIGVATAELAKSQAAVKHVIILTDGETTGDFKEGLVAVRRLKAANTTISTVAIGDRTNDGMLAELAKAGGGRSHQVRSEKSKAVLPQIFIKEAQTVRRTLIREGKPFAPLLALPGDSMRGIAMPLPGMTGYVVTADRGGLSTVQLRGPENDPILAQWQHGLGRVSVYTSDAAARWNAAWIAWSGFDSFWMQQLKWVMRPGGDGRSRISIQPNGDKAKVAIELLDPSGERVNFAKIQARLIPPDTSQATTPTDVAFQQVGPGRYEAEVETTLVGSHLLMARYDAPGSSSGNIPASSGSLRAAIIRRGGEEFRQPVPNTSLLWDIARRTNGRIYKLDDRGTDLWGREHLTMPVTLREIWIVVAIAACGLFLVDVGARRVAIDKQAIKATLQTLWTSKASPTAASVATLAQVRARGQTSAKARFESAHTPPPLELADDQTSTPKSGPSASPPSAGAKAPPPSAPSPGPQDTMGRLRAAKRRSQQD